MTSRRSDFNSDAQWLENEIAELNTFSERARQRAQEADGDEKHRQLTDVAVKLRVREERLAHILEMLKAAKPLTETAASTPATTKRIVTSLHSSSLTP